MMKNFIFKNPAESSLNNVSQGSNSNTKQSYNINSSRSNNSHKSTKVKLSELKINTTNENLSPNSNNSKSSSGIAFPNTTKNSIKNSMSKLKEKKEISTDQHGAIMTGGSPGIFSGIIDNGPLSSRNKENSNRTGKLYKMNSISELSKMKVDKKLIPLHSAQNKQQKKEFKDLKNLITSSQNKNEIKANLDKVKISHKSFGVIQGYSAITTEGLYRDYNEDRVAIIYNISKPSNFIETEDNLWPKCSFFGLYDGHGGSGCADFLRDNLHKYIINDPHFPKNPQKAILNGFVKSEKTFLQNAMMVDKTETGERLSILDRSGSCAIIVLIIEKRCYIANVGDSRAIMSGNFGEKVYSLSRDHRPNDEKEYTRVLENGGKIYQTEANTNSYTNNIVGPLRVVPGKLSVSRAIGDIEAKDSRIGGNPNVIISIPEIKYFDINSTNDYIIIGCDGIFEKMKNKEIIENMWKIINNPQSEYIKDSHNLNGVLIENLIDTCLIKKSTDNLTAVLISFKSNLRDKENHLESNYISQTHQVNKIPKVIKTEGNHIPSGLNQNILSKIIKTSQAKNFNQNSDKFMSLNK